MKLALLGVWVILVTAAATYASVHFQADSSATTGEEAESHGTEEIKTEMTSVPMIRNGEIIGYVIIQLSFQADALVLESMHVEPAPYLVDAAFRVIFASTDVDFRRLRGSDLNELTSSIAAEANARIGGALVKTVLIQQLNFVSKEDIRTNWIGDGKH